MDFFAWLRLLTTHRFAVEPAYWYIAAAVSGTSFANTLLGWLQHASYGERIRRTPLAQPPLFVLGHWRTGTTLLHELLVLDPRHAAPSSFHCFEPNHSLISEQFFKRYLNFLMPQKRPMDNMAVGWDRPQEDEFALCLLGMPSTYADLAFPNHPGTNDGALDLTGLTPRQMATWKRTLMQFVKRLSLRDPRRLVMKSPPHTARVPVLREMFPHAKYIAIVRDPYEVFASTVHLWTTLANKHGLQLPRSPERIEAKVFREFRILHERYEVAKGAIPTGHLVELRYEELIADMPGTMAAVYASLDLGEWNAVRPAIEQFATGQKAYAKNRYAADETTRAKVRAEWGDIIDAQGY